MVQICFPECRGCSSLGRETKCLYGSGSTKPVFYSLALRSDPVDPLGEFPRSAALAEREASRRRWGIAAARLSLYCSPWQVRTYLRWLALLPPLLPSHLSRCTFIFCWHADIRAIRQRAFPFCSLFSPSQCCHGWIVATVAGCKVFTFQPFLPLHLF